MALCMVTAMTLIVTPIVQMSLNTYKITMRNRLRAEARAVAESEVDYLFYQMMSKMLNGAIAADTPDLLAADGITDAFPANAANPAPTTDRTPFLALQRNGDDSQGLTGGWRVRRSMQFNVSEFGPIENTSKLGNFSYVTARVEVIPPATSSFGDKFSVRVGRRFLSSDTSVFQYGFFYEGDLEFNPGGNSVIEGDIVANGSIFMGPRNATLTLRGKVRAEAFNTFNLAGTTTSVDAAGNAITVATSTPTASRVNPKTYALESTRSAASNLLSDPTWDYSQEQQFSPLEKKENLLGGADPNTTAQNYPVLFGPQSYVNPAEWSAAQKAEAANNVSRSLIAPPPLAASNAENRNGASADSPTIAAARAYNRAGIIVTVGADGSLLINKVANNITTDVTAQFAAAVTAPAPLWDNRESKAINTLTVDIAALKTTLESTHPDFNGMLYVNLKDATSDSPSAVRLVNATSLPTNGDSTRGFSLATNGGLYVQGSFNTTNYGSEASPRNLPAMLMADSITVLSTGYEVKSTATPLSERVATLSVAETAAGSAKIVAGLLTGNVASAQGSGSGGAQNLVRYIENWGGKNIIYKGSLARLFNSRYFTSPFSVTSTGQVYNPPAARTFSYDRSLQRNVPPQAPSATDFRLGTYFTW